MARLTEFAGDGTVRWTQSISAGVGGGAHSGGQVVADLDGRTFLVETTETAIDVVARRGAGELWRVTVDQGQLWFSDLLLASDGLLWAYITRFGNPYNVAYIVAFDRNTGTQVHSYSKDEGPYLYDLQAHDGGLVAIGAGTYDNLGFVDFLRSDGTTARHVELPNDSCCSTGSSVSQLYTLPSGSTYLVRYDCNYGGYNSCSGGTIFYLSPHSGLAWSKSFPYSYDPYGPAWQGGTVTSDGGLVINANLAPESVGSAGNGLTKFNADGSVAWTIPAAGSVHFHGPMAADTLGHIYVGTQEDGRLPEECGQSTASCTALTWHQRVASSGLLTSSSALLTALRPEFKNAIGDHQASLVLFADVNEQGARDYRLSSLPMEGQAFPASQIAPDPDPDQFNYVALGDSFSAGEGLSPYLKDGYMDGGYGKPNRCHRSRKSYAARVEVPGSGRTVYSLANPVSSKRRNLRRSDIADWSFWACSGAVINNVRADGQPRYEDQLAQLDNPEINANTDLVTLTIGGNDAAFADVLGDCFRIILCMEGSNSGLKESLKTSIDTLGPLLSDLYVGIGRKAPNARVLVVGYPQLFPFSREEQGCFKLQPKLPAYSEGFLNFEYEEQDDFRELTFRLNAVIQAAVQDAVDEGAPVEYVPVISRFAGHEVCGDAGEWIHGPSIKKKDGEWNKDQTFHPNARGHSRGYAATINERLAAG